MRVAARMNYSIDGEPDFTKQATLSCEEPLGNNQFRLIHLHAGQREDDVKFNIARHSLEPGELPFYEAVSYVLVNTRG